MPLGLEALNCCQFATSISWECGDLHTIPLISQRQEAWCALLRKAIEVKGENLIQKANWEDVIAMNTQRQGCSQSSMPRKSIAMEVEDLSMWEELNPTIAD